MENRETLYNVIKEEAVLTEFRSENGCMTLSIMTFSERVFVKQFDF